MEPRDPTRYAATMVLPCPGDRACTAPRPNAARMQRAISFQPRSFRGSMRDRKSPATTVPAAAGCCCAKEAGAGVAVADGAGLTTIGAGVAPADAAGAGAGLTPTGAGVAATDG